MTPGNPQPSAPITPAGRRLKQAGHHPKMMQPAKAWAAVPRPEAGEARAERAARAITRRTNHRYVIAPESGEDAQRPAARLRPLTAHRAAVIDILPPEETRRQPDPAVRILAGRC